jgi:hypothetical protein
VVLLSLQPFLAYGTDLTASRFLAPTEACEAPLRSVDSVQLAFIERLQELAKGLPVFPRRKSIQPHSMTIRILQDAFDSERDLPWIYNAVDLFGPYLSGSYPNIALSLYKGALIVTSEKPDGELQILKPLGVSDVDATVLMLEILERFKSQFKSLTFVAVPERLREALVLRKNLQVDIERDDTNPTYLYSAFEIAALEGSKFKAQRRRVNQFVTNHSNYVWIDLTNCNQTVVFHEIQDLANRWLQSKTFATEAEQQDAELDVATIANYYLKNFNSLGFYGGAVAVDGKIVAFQIANRKSNDTVSFLAAKADTQYEGAYQVLYKLMAERVVLPLGYSKIDMQSDSAMAGLRSNKLSWNPISVVSWLDIRRR